MGFWSDFCWGCVSFFEIFVDSRLSVFRSGFLDVKRFAMGMKSEMLSAKIAIQHDRFFGDAPLNERGMFINFHHYNLGLYLDLYSIIMYYTSIILYYYIILYHIISSSLNQAK
jgi:hypothetical protein